MTMITPSYLGETIEYSSLHACRSTLEDPTLRRGLETELIFLKLGITPWLIDGIGYENDEGDPLGSPSLELLCG